MVDVTGNVRHAFLQVNSLFCRAISRPHICFRHGDVLLELYLDVILSRIIHDYKNNCYEFAEIRQNTAGGMRKDDTALDIGAAIGFLTAATDKAEIRPTLLVIDIEGGEVELRAAAGLDGVSRVMREIHEHSVGREGGRAVFASLARESFAYNQHLSCANVVTFDRCVRQ